MPLFEYEPRSDIEPGTYEVTVTDVTPDVIVPRQGKNAGKDVKVLRWEFALESGESIEGMTGRDPSSEKSNLFKYLVALVGPNKAEWEGLDAKDLVGRMALASIGLNDGGYPRIDGLAAMPKSKARTARVVEPETEDDLPF